LQKQSGNSYFYTFVRVGLRLFEFWDVGGSMRRSFYVMKIKRVCNLVRSLPSNSLLVYDVNLSFHVRAVPLLGDCFAKCILKGTIY